MPNKSFTLSANGGTVTSVGLNPTGTSGSAPNVTGSPITGAGTINLNIPLAAASGVTSGTISKVQYDIFNGKFTLPSLTPKSVLFSDGTTIVQDNSFFQYDLTNHNLGLGTPTSSAIKLNMAYDGSVSNSQGLRIGLTGNATDYWSITNATLSNAVFIPTFTTKSDTSAYGASGVFATAFTVNANDVAYNTGYGNGAGIVFDSRNYSNTGILTTRNLFAWGSFNNVRMVMDAAGRLAIRTAATGGFGAITQPTATIHIGADNGGSPLRFTSATLPVIPLAGNLDFLTDRLYLTTTTGPTRREIALWGTSTPTTGRVVFIDINGQLTDAQNLAYNAASSLLRIGHNNTQSAFADIAASTASNASLRLRAGVAPTSPNEGDMWTDSTQKAVTKFADGITQYTLGNIFTSTADATVTNTTTETTLLGTGVGTKTLPANFFVAGKTIRIRVKGIKNDPGTHTLRIKAKYGATVVLDTGVQNSKATTGSTEFSVDTIITCRTTGASGTVMAQGEFIYFQDAITLYQNQMVNTAAITINTTTSNALDVTATWGTASATDTITGTNVTIEILN